MRILFLVKVIRESPSEVTFELRPEWRDCTPDGNVEEQSFLGRENKYVRLEGGNMSTGTERNEVQYGWRPLRKEEYDVC